MKMETLITFCFAFVLQCIQRELFPIKSKDVHEAP